MTTIEPVRLLEQPQTTSVTPVRRGDDFGPEMGWEFEYAAKHPIAYPLLKTALDILPFGWTATPSGRAQFTEASTGGKALTLGLDAAVLLPLGVIGKGIKITTQPLLAPIRAGVKRLPFRIKNVAEQSKVVMDDLARQTNSFSYMTKESGLVSKYGVTDTAEIQAAIRGRSVVEDSIGRSGLLVERKDTSAAFKALFTDKGVLRSKVKKNLVKWSVPKETQLSRFQVKEWEKVVKKYANVAEYDIDAVFKNQALRLFSPDRVKGMTLKNIGGEDFDLLMKDALLNRGRLVKNIDSKSWHYFAPVEKLMGKFEPLYGTITRIFKPVSVASDDTNRLSSMYLGEFQAYMAAKGLGKVDAKGVFKHILTPKEVSEAGKLVVAQGVARSSGKSTAVIQGMMDKASANVQKVAKSHEQFMDFLYDDYLKKKVPQIVGKSGLNDFGKLQFDRLFLGPDTGLIHKVTAALSTEANSSYEYKYKAISETMASIRKAFTENPNWFLGYDDVAGKLTKAGIKDTKKLTQQLTLREGRGKAGFPNYLENYTPRMYEEYEGLSAKKATLGGTKITAGFTKARIVEEPVGLVEDIETLVVSRLRAQAKDLHLYPVREEVLNFSKANLPENLRAYTRHYVNRLVGMPSDVDAKVAKILTGTFGSAWDANRVMRLSYSINDLIYMGGIGFKPFSAMRNEFQAFLTVPADMGGVKSLEWFAKSYKLLMKKETRDFIKSTGAIADYTPDLLFKPAIFGFGKTRKILGKEFTLPAKDKVRDAAMFMFKNSEHRSRFIAGGAGIAKWDYYINKFAKFDKTGRPSLNGRALEDFKKKLNLYTREPWIRTDIEALLRTGRADGLEEAKKTWVKSIINDTQFLYGTTGSPLIGHVGGPITRTAAVFQTWWMHYGALLNKWITRSESVDAAAGRMFNWMLTSAVSYELMKAMWGQSVAASSVLFGPFPTGFDVPPSWRPMSDSLKLAVSAGSVPMGISSLETVRKRMKSVLNSSLIFIPGGLQLKQTLPSAIEGDVPGLMASLVRYRGGE